MPRRGRTAVPEWSMDKIRRITDLPVG